MKGEGANFSNLEGGFEELAVAGGPGHGLGDDHVHRVPVAVFVILERFVRADPRVVVDPQLVCEDLVVQVQAAVRIPGERNSSGRMKSPSYDSAVSISVTFGANFSRPPSQPPEQLGHAAESLSG